MQAREDARQDSETGKPLGFIEPERLNDSQGQLQVVPTGDVEFLGAGATAVKSTELF